MPSCQQLVGESGVSEIRVPTTVALATEAHVPVVPATGVSAVCECVFASEGQE